MENHDIIIEIGKDGKVHAEIRGVKGKSCLQYAKLLEQIIGKQVTQELTAEYYEPDSAVSLNAPVQDHQQQTY